MLMWIQGSPQNEVKDRDYGFLRAAFPCTTWTDVAKEDERRILATREGVSILRKTRLKNGEYFE